MFTVRFQSVHLDSITFHGEIRELALVGPLKLNIESFQARTARLYNKRQAKGAQSKNYSSPEGTNQIKETLLLLAP